MRVQYIEKTFRGETLRMIELANAVIDEYMQAGLKLTLRQLYYQFVARGYIDNQQSEYKRLGSIISDGRLAGLVDWSAIEDRTRNIQKNGHWSNAGEIIQAAASTFAMDRWMYQHYRPEVWIEKEALVGVVADICRDLDVTYFACRGYVSQSEMWEAGQRLKVVREVYHQSPIIIHLGDHDPSGIDMTRDISERLGLFLPFSVEVNRIALNMDQVDEFGPPPNPTKLRDSRSGGYVKKFGMESWELDALEPKILRSLISDTVKKYRDEDTYAMVLDIESKHRETLYDFVDNWEDS